MVKKPAYLSKIKSLMSMSFYTLNPISTLQREPLKIYEFLTDYILSKKTFRNGEVKVSGLVISGGLATDSH